MKALTIADYRRMFVKSQASRDRAFQDRGGRLAWIAVPLKNGAGFLEVLSYDDGPHLYGCFLLLARAAADTEHRGVFVRHGRALSRPEIARLSSIPLDKIDSAIERLMAVGWLIESDSQSDLESDSQSDPESDIKSYGQDKTGQDTRGLFPTSTEGSDEGKPEPRSPSPKGSPKPRGFTPPTAAEVREYAKTIGDPEFDGMKFVAYYAARGWRFKGNVPMKSWRAAVVTWLKNRGNE